MKKKSKVLLAVTGTVIGAVSAAGVLSYKKSQKEIGAIRIEARPGE